MFASANRPVRESLLAGAFVALTLFLASCGMPESTQPAPGSGPGGREQPLALSPRQELAVGRRAYSQVLAEFQGRVLPADGPQTRRARRVLARLVKAAEVEPLQREINLRIRGYRFEWDVNVIRSEQVNAFCVPAGKMALFTGILDVIGESDDHLATVLAHEMAHALAHHASERVAREDSGPGVLRSLSYNRMQESEADHIGVFLMAFAEYDPAQAIAFWQKMREKSGGKGRLPEIFSDHPGNESRIRALRAWAPQARAAKKAFDSGHVLPPSR